jgi:hypothetical protein
VIAAAIPPDLREDAQIKPLFEAANEGDPQAAEQLYSLLLRPISDEKIRRLVRECRQGEPPEAPESLFDELEERLRTLKQRYLYPGSDTESPDGGPSESSIAEDSEGLDHIGAGSHQTRSRVEVLFEAQRQWGRLVKDIREVAERFWRDYFLDIDFVASRKIGRRLRDRKRKQPSQREGHVEAVGEIEDLEQLARRARLLLWLGLEASLYRIRSFSNFESREMIAAGVGGENPTRKEIRGLVREYIQTTRRWDKELKGTVGQAFFRVGFGDAQRLKRLAQQFGPDQVSEDEEGWGAQAVDAQTELRYQLFDEILRERWRAKKVASAISFTILKFTTGYGTRPGYFVGVALAIILVFGLLFFLNDFFNPGIGSNQHFCPGATASVANWYDPILIVLRYLYVAVTNLSTLGSNSQVASYCGGTSTQLLLSVATITGYILLGLLATLAFSTFFKLLTEAEG